MTNVITGVSKNNDVNNIEIENVGIAQIRIFYHYEKMVVQ